MNGLSPELNQHPLKSSALKAALVHPQGRFARVEVVVSSGSTNTDLGAGAANVDEYWPSLSVLIADAQPAGKGRMGRSWEVPPGAAMISSVFLRPGEDLSPGRGVAFVPTGYGWLSILAGVALCTVLRSVTGVPAELKWPNDVVVKGRKVAGILAQLVPATPGVQTLPGAQGSRGAQPGPGVVVGVGVNVSLDSADLPTERATSLLLESASTLDRNVLLPAYLNKFAALYLDFVAVGGDAQRPLGGAQGRSVLELAQAYMSTLGQEVRAELPGGTMLHGTATALDADGSLVLRDASGTLHTVSAGDVIHLRRTGPGGTVNYA